MNEYYHNAIDYIKMVNELSFDFLTDDKPEEPLYYEPIESLCYDYMEELKERLPLSSCTVAGEPAVIMGIIFHKTLIMIEYYFHNSIKRNVTSNVNAVVFL